MDMVYRLGERLMETDLNTVLQEQRPAVLLTGIRECRKLLDTIHLNYDGEISFSDAHFCKIETQQECLYGTFAVPHLLDVLGMRHRMLLFVNHRYIVIVDEDGLAERLINGIRRKKNRQGESKEQFLYHFISEIITRDALLLEEYEKYIMDLEDAVMHFKIHDFQNKMMPVRKKLSGRKFSFYEDIMIRLLI